MPRKLGFVFPGQGSQSIGMLSEHFAGSNIFNDTFDIAREVLGVDFKKLIFEGTAEDLSATQVTQPLLLTANHAIWKTTNISPSEVELMAGHSLGEYSALVASEKLNFAKAIYLVRKRGEAMQTAVPPGVGSMAAVMRMDAEDLSSVCSEVSKQTGKPVELANYNSPQQIVIAGYKESVNEVVARLKAEKKRAILLPVSAPFHSSLMLPAAAKLEKFFDGITFDKNDIPYIANIDAKKYEAGTSANQIKKNLVEQVAGSVQWAQSFSKLAEDEICFEVGPGKTLMGLGRSINRKIKITPLDGVNLKETIQ